MPTNRSYHSYLIESLKDPQEAAAYLDAVLEDGTSEELSLALKNVAEAQSALRDSQQSANHEAAYPVLSQQADLDLSTLSRMLNGLGFKLSVSPKKNAA
ncbi:helix-turn-helix domain-containing transcriptional regulator [Phormidesmis priestleyi]